MSVRCVSPWYSLFVYSPEMIKVCCFSHFNLVEKEKKQSLEELWNGEKVQEFRKAMLDGNTERFCPPQCPMDKGYTITLLDREINEDSNSPHEINKKICRELIKSKATFIESKPIKMQINLSHTCNIRCVMCQLKPFKLSQETLEECRQYYPYLSHIDFTGGEPLLSSIDETLLVINRYPHIKMGVVTNGTLLGDVWIDTIIKHFEWIIISINGTCRETHEKVNRGSKWDNVFNNIQKLIAARDKKNLEIGAVSSEPLVVLSMVVLKSNYLEMKALLKLGYELGCDVAFIPCEGDIEENAFYEVFKDENICGEVRQIIEKIKEQNKVYKVQLFGIDAILDCVKPR